MNRFAFVATKEEVISLLPPFANLFHPPLVGDLSLTSSCLQAKSIMTGSAHHTLWQCTKRVVILQFFDLEVFANLLGYLQSSWELVPPEVSGIIMGTDLYPAKRGSDE